MSNEEKKKRAEYKAHRKKWIMIQSAIIAVLLLVLIFSTFMYYRSNKILYVNYNESSEIDYKVYLKENDFYEEEFLGEDQVYVASLIDNVAADFKYDLNISEEEKVKYNYKVEYSLEIIDNKTKVIIYNPIEEVINQETLESSATNKLKVREQISIDYSKYNRAASSFISTYDLKDVSSTLVVNMSINIISIDGQSLEDTKSEYKVSLNVPLIDQKISIKMTSSIPEQDGKVAYDNTKTICVYKVISIISACLVVLAIITILAFIYLTRNQDINYAIKVKKIVNNYKSYIQKINNKFAYQGYQVLMVDTFKEMLEIRDTIDAPILMNENEDQTCTRFIIPTNTKLLYMFEIKVEGFCYDPDEELLGVVDNTEEEVVEEISVDSKVDEVAENNQTEEEVKAEEVVETQEEVKEVEQVAETQEEVKEEKPVKEPKPKKVITPSIEVLAEYIKSNFEDAMIVYGKENKSYRVFRKKKLFLIVQSTNNDYRITFQRKPISMAQLLIKYPKFITKVNSPQGEQWFKIVNKGDIYEEELKAIIRFSYKYLIDEEKKALAKKQKAKEKALAKKAALKAKEKAKRDAQKAKEKAKADALKAKSKKAAEEKAKKQATKAEESKENKDITA